MSGRTPDEVQLHLLRHAHAGDPLAWDGPDDVRPLSVRGRSQAERLGTFLVAIRFRTDALLTSPKARARETADLVGEALGVPVVVEPRLGTILSVRTVEAILRDAGDPLRPVLVGHDPDFSDLLLDLAGSPATSGLRMKKGAMACLVARRPLREGDAELRWLVPPDLLER